MNWSVGSSSFATIAGETGTTATVRARDDVGWTTVTAESGGHKATADIYVSENVALQVRPSTTFLPPECSGLVTARLITDQGVTQDVTRDVSWSVSNSDAITVATGNSSAGLVEAGTPDTVPVASVVRASYRGRRASGRVTVADLELIAFIDSHDGQAVPAGGIELAQGEPRRLRAMGTFTTPNGEFPEFPDRDVTGCVEWSSDDPNVATVDTGLITAGSEDGTTHVTASYGDDPLENSVTVTVNQDLMTGLFIDEKDQVNINQGATKNLIARARISDDPDPAPDITAAVDWRSDDPGIATVGNETGSRGRVTGGAPGQAVVTAALSGFDDSVTVNVTSDPDEPGELSMNADPNVVLAGDSNDVSEICTYLISNDLDDLILNTGITFSIVEGEGRADLQDETVSTGVNGQACTDLKPKDESEPGSVIVRAEESDSGLAETVNVALVSSLADVFDTTGDVDPPISDGTVSSDTVFQATLVNGSNREFTVDAATLAFCTTSGTVDVSTQGPIDDQVPGGGEIVVSVETNNEHTSDGFAIALSLSDEDGDPVFPVRHQFGDTDVEDCDPDSG